MLRTPKQGNAGIPVLIATALLAAIAVLWCTSVLLGNSGPFLGDFDAYWQAGVRLRDGSPLYFTPANHADSTIYRYAPWFAWVWVPLTLLPMPLVQAAWLTALLAAGAFALWPMRSHPVVLLLGPPMLAATYYGNVQALMVAALAYGLGRRSGPGWIALTASLKAVPLLFVLVYVGRRQWSAAALTIGLTLVLVAPMLLYDLSGYPARGQAIGLAAEAPAVWVGVASACAATTLRLARTRYAWLAAASTVLVALPRFAPYDLSFMASVRSADKRESEKFSGQASGKATVGNGT